MPKEKKPRDSAEEKGGIDPEILDVIQEEKRKLAGAAGRESTERERILKIFQRESTKSDTG